MKTPRIPKRMAHLPIVRGYPVPVIVYRDTEGNPHFTVNNEGDRVMALYAGHCAICGNDLLSVRWFVGGPGCAFDPVGAYLDPPMHRECAHYALQVCPYLAAPRYSGQLADIIEKRGIPAAAPNQRFRTDKAVNPNRPDLFVAVGSRGINIEQRVSQPTRPYAGIEFWQHGRQLSQTRGLTLLPPEYRGAAQRMLRNLQPRGDHQ